jgi:hypothetical protein
MRLVGGVEFSLAFLISFFILYPSTFNSLVQSVDDGYALAGGTDSFDAGK